MNPIPSAVNIRSALLRDHSGDAIIAGTVNYYLKAITGANAGKWYVSDNSWNAAETAYGAATHEGSGSWSRSVRAEGWVNDVFYVEYWIESTGKIGSAGGNMGALSCNPSGADAAAVKVVTDKLATMIEEIP